MREEPGGEPWRFVWLETPSRSLKEKDRYLSATPVNSFGERPACLVLYRAVLYPPLACGRRRCIFALR